LWYGALVILFGIGAVITQEVLLGFSVENKAVKFIPSFFKSLTKADIEEMI